MKIVFGMILGWFLASWYMNPMYGCEKCDCIKTWALYESYATLNELDEYHEDDPEYIFLEGKMLVLDHLILNFY